MESPNNKLKEEIMDVENGDITVENKANKQEHDFQNLRKQFENPENSPEESSDTNVSSRIDITPTQRIFCDAATFSCCLLRSIFCGLLYFFIYVIVWEDNPSSVLLIVAVMILSIISEMFVGRFQGKIWKVSYILYLPAFTYIIIAFYQDTEDGYSDFYKFFTIGCWWGASAQALVMIQLARGDEKPKVLILSYLAAAISIVLLSIESAELYSLILYSLHALLLCWGLPEKKSQSGRSVTANKEKNLHRASHLSKLHWKTWIRHDKDELDYDTYSMMMISPFWTVISFQLCWKYKETIVVITCPSLCWITGLFTSIIQLGLGFLIAVDKWDKSEFDTDWNIPVRIDLIVATGQFMLILTALIMQRDILVAVQMVNRLWYKQRKEGKNLEWKILMGKESNARLSLWCFRILLPNILKMFQGILVLITSFVVIIQSDDIVDLLKVFTALFIISSLDNMIFMAADFKCLGRELSKKVNEVKAKKLKKGKSKINVLLHAAFACITLVFMGGWIFIRISQTSGKYMKQKYPNCSHLIRNSSLLPWMGDRMCQELLNTEECGWDGGDCIVLDAYPDCNVDYQSWIGNGQCDGGDYNTEKCNWDGGDCIEFNKKYPDCFVTEPFRIDNGWCDGGDYYTAECDWDGGDCIDDNEKHSDCQVEYPFSIGNGECDGGDYNTEECGWDGGDCIEFNKKYPDCDVTEPFRIDNGDCDGGDYNTEECDWDGGDCIEFNEKYPDCNVEIPTMMGDGYCNGGAYNTEECGWDGGDCIEFNTKYPNCNVTKPFRIGDGRCDGDDDNCKIGYPSKDDDEWCHIGKYNTEKCGWDGGDCIEFNENYPDCNVESPWMIDNGWCDGGDYNTEECGWDGGDCIEFNDKYPDCTVKFPRYIGNGKCHDGIFNTEECGWDGGDCFIYNKYSGCNVDMPSRIGNGQCDGDTYNTEECGWDGGDCIEFNEKYPNCNVPEPFRIDNGSCDGGVYNTEECGWDGGDCIDNDNGYMEKVIGSVLDVRP